MTINNNYKIYYKNKYWNEYPQVVEYINQSISGDKDTDMILFLSQYFKDKKFKRALMLNCGNGWFERKLCDYNIANSYIGIDCSEDLINQAKKETKDLPLEYHIMDTNLCKFPHENYDLIVNHAACHHLAYLEKVLFEASRILDKNGFFVSFDYVGPHRNQYPEKLWTEIQNLNKKLTCKQNLSYPHLPTMLFQDPTEAIHSELFLETHSRYFDIIYHKKIGGALAYPLITFNQNLISADEDVRNQQIEFLIKADEAYLNKNPESSFFDFIISKPKKNLNLEEIEKYLKSESSREESAKKNFGCYYELNEFQKNYIYNQFLSDSNQTCKNWQESMNILVERWQSKDFLTSKIFYEKSLGLKN